MGRWSSTTSPTLRREMQMDAHPAAACGASLLMGRSTCPSSSPHITVSVGALSSPLVVLSRIFLCSCSINLGFIYVKTGSGLRSHAKRQYFCRGNKTPLMDSGSVSSASRERSIIERGLVSFHDVSCIRFVPRSNQRDYLNIMSDNG